jgi:ABC-type microcin C transport system duplicated ATPase subunit YejF
MGIIFQESALALNPVLTVGSQIGDVVRAHMRCNRKDVRERTFAVMHEVGLTDDTQRIYEAYPHELSGGQRQRFSSLGRSYAPAFVVADEPGADADVRDDPPA